VTAAREVVLRVHPTQEAERRRQDVVGYLRRLIGSTFGFEVRALPSLSHSLPPRVAVACPSTGRRAVLFAFFGGWGDEKKAFSFLLL
jgi:hypothetical protein